MPPLTRQLLEPGADGAAVDHMGPPIRTNTHYSMSSLDDEPVHETIVPGEVEAWNSRLHGLWNQVMEKGPYTTSPNYEKIEALLLYHDSASDDLDVKKEIDELKKVFSDEYHYGVQCSAIQNQFTKKSQTQVNAIVANWAWEHDGPNTLLIVYFAGHGTPSDDGRLHLTGRKVSPLDIDREFNQVVWDNTEKNLHNLIADVLQIFDCCFAATFDSRAYGNQTIEYLAACDKNETTPAPGRDSFTAALIWALRDHKRQGGRFTVSNLRESIKRHPHFQKKGKHPQWHRLAEKPMQQRIMLHPLESPKTHGERGGNVKKENMQRPEDEYLLELKFAFNSMPTDDNITQLAENINNTVRVCRLPMSHVQWGGILPRESKLLKVVKIFQDHMEERKKFKKRPHETAEDDVHIPALKRAAINFKQAIHEQVHEEVKEELLAELTHRDVAREHEPSPIGQAENEI